VGWCDSQSENRLLNPKNNPNPKVNHHQNLIQPELVTKHSNPPLRSRGLLNPAPEGVQQWKLPSFESEDKAAARQRCNDKGRMVHPLP